MKESKPKYLEIADAIHQEIRQEIYKQGDKLPVERELQERFGVRDGKAESLLGVMLRSGEYTALMDAVMEVNGYKDDVNDLIEEAKN